MRTPREIHLSLLCSSSGQTAVDLLPAIDAKVYRGLAVHTFIPRKLARLVSLAFQQQNSFEMWLFWLWSPQLWKSPQILSQSDATFPGNKHLI